MNYHTYIVSPEWKEKADRIKQRDGRCLKCGSKRRLNAHHGTYERLGEEKDGDLFTLCEKCHETLHRVFSKERRARESYNVQLLAFTRKFLKSPKKKRKRRTAPKQPAPKFKKPTAFDGLLVSMSRKKERKPVAPEPAKKKTEQEKRIEKAKTKAKMKKEKRRRAHERGKQALRDLIEQRRR